MNDDPKKNSRGDFELSITKELKERKNPFVRTIFTVAAIGALFMIFGFVVQMVADSKNEVESAPHSQHSEEMHLTTHGEAVCIKCTLGISEQHHRAIRYRGDGNEEKIVLLNNNPELNMDLRFFCDGPTPCLVEGDFINSGDLRILQITAFRAFPVE